MVRLKGVGQWDLLLSHIKILMIFIILIGTPKNENQASKDLIKRLSKFSWMALSVRS